MNTLEALLSTSKIFDIVLKDFQIDTVTNSTSNFQQIMSQYNLKNYKPVFISGSLFNHVYISRQALEKFSLEIIQTVGIYHPDHKVVKFNLRLL